MTQITSIQIDQNNLNIGYKGADPKPPSEDGTVIMTYYGQWGIYVPKFPVPSYATAKTDIYDKITHLSYGFMGFNGSGDIGTWDTNADTAGSGTRAYGKLFYDNLFQKGSFVKAWSGLYSMSYPLDNQKFPSESIKGTSSQGQQFYRLAYAKHTNPNMKIIMSFGGWEYASASPDSTWDADTPPAQVFFNITQNSSIFNKYVNNVVDMIKNYKFQIIEYQSKYYPVPYITPNGNLNSPTVHDEVKNGKLADGYTRIGNPFNLFSGVDIDWEYPDGCGDCANCTSSDINSQCPGGWLPSSSDTEKSYEGYAKLLSTLKDKLGSEYFVSTTCAGDPSKINNLVSNTSVVNAFNKINRVSIMTYDFMNGNSYITHDSPLYKQVIGSKQWNADAAVQNMLQKVNPKKVNLGIPYYGRFQYIKDQTLTDLGYGGGIPNQTITDKIFSGNTPGLYTACAQSSKNAFSCPWVDGQTVSINSVNYNINPTTPTPPDKLCGGNCNFGDSNIKDKFYEVNDAVRGVTYYLSKDTYTNSNIFSNAPSRIILSMPSKYSIDQKTNYVKSKGLGGVITWMVGNDTSYTLAGYVHDGLKQ